MAPQRGPPAGPPSGATQRGHPAGPPSGGVSRWRGCSGHQTEDPARRARSGDAYPPPRPKYRGDRTAISDILIISRNPISITMNYNVQNGQNGQKCYRASATHHPMIRKHISSTSSGRKGGPCRFDLTSFTCRPADPAPILGAVPRGPPPLKIDRTAISVDWMVWVPPPSNTCYSLWTSLEKPQWAGRWVARLGDHFGAFLEHPRIKTHLKTASITLPMIDTSPLADKGPRG
eukprot:gene7310-biopygen3037